MTAPLFSNAGFLQALEVRKGSTFRFEIELTNEDDTPYDTADIDEVRAAMIPVGGGTAINFTCDLVAPSTTGKAGGYLTAAQTGALTAYVGKLPVATYEWNCDIKMANGDIIPFCYGPVFVVGGAVTWP